MKIAIIGAAGVRTPLIIQTILKRQAALEIEELALMDMNAERLEVIGAITACMEKDGAMNFRITRTTDVRKALSSADFVITTFRVGGIEGRVVDERVPLKYGVLGQETTGPGGFAMGMRTIPVLLDYIRVMREVCPNAWLINFSNPSGMMTEALIRVGKWSRTIGICDAPDLIHRFAALAVGAPPEEVYLDYFGLNHLGWVRSVIHKGKDYVPQFIDMIRSAGGMPGLPFAVDLIATLGMIPNEYLYYYYHAREAVTNILSAGKTRGEQLAEENASLFSDLRQLLKDKQSAEMLACYRAYILKRGFTYMEGETSGKYEADRFDPASIQFIAEEGYANVALGVIEALIGAHPHVMILNVPNCGSIGNFAADAVVEIPVLVEHDFVRPMAVGIIPAHCLGLMQQVKAYELLTIEAATEHAYAKAVAALTVHPLVRDHATAKSILDDYIRQHGELFPVLHEGGQ